MQRDEAEGTQFHGKTLETFRDNHSGTIRVRGGMCGGFTVVIRECGDVVIHYHDEERTIRVAPGAETSIEWKSEHANVPSPRSKPAKRGSR